MIPLVNLRPNLQNVVGTTSVIYFPFFNFPNSRMHYLCNDAVDNKCIFLLYDL